MLTKTDEGETCTGAVAYELATGEIHVFQAKSVVLATAAPGRSSRPPPTRTR